MKHMIIGTAGHIDHGKTALIRALTGRDTDRLPEEQKRGISIELGFTWFDLKDGTRCGIVDVPGHEKFVRHMVTGVAGMDLVLMVVAADEGVMPQTREHLDILELLGIEKTILVFSKCDLVDEDWMRLVEEDTKRAFAGTIMEHAPSVHISSVTGQGLDELKDLIGEMVRGTESRRDVMSIPRLPLDRVFTVPGHGTVVTGTLLSGSISKGESLHVFPTGKTVRVRSVQVHEETVERCEAGQRAALNLAGTDREELWRGCVLAPAESMKNTSLIDVDLTVLKDSARKIRNRERLHLYTGTAEILCRASLLDREELKPGETGPAQLLLEEETALRRGDRFVVRFYSPPGTIGGGIVLDANPAKKKRFREDVLRELEKKKNGSPADVIELKIGEWEGPVSLPELAKNTGRTEDELLPYLRELAGRGAVLEYPLRRETWYWHAGRAFHTGQEIAAALRKFREAYPYRFGIPKAEIHHTFMRHVKPNVFDECMKRMVSDGLFEMKGDLVCLPDSGILKDRTFLGIEKTLTDVFEKAGYQLLRLSEIDMGSYPDGLVTDVLRVMEAEDSIVRVAGEPEVYTMKHFMDEAEEKVRAHFRTDDVLTLINIREMFATNRKSARLIAEYLDRMKITKKADAAAERVAFL